MCTKTRTFPCFCSYSYWRRSAFISDIMSYTDEFIEEIRAELISRKEQITKELAQFTEEGSTGNKARFPNLGDSEDENAQEVASYSDRLSLNDNLEKILRDINNALERIEAQNYGICKYCNNLIGEARLKARPDSSSCIDCKKGFIGE